MSTSGAPAVTASSRSPGWSRTPADSLGHCSRLARSLSWCSDSSPDTYSTLANAHRLVADLEHQGGFADARRAAHQHQRALHRRRRPAPGPPPHAGGEPDFRIRLQLRHRPGPPDAPPAAGAEPLSLPGRPSGAAPRWYSTPRRPGTSPPTWASHCRTPCSRTGSLASLQPPMERETNRLSDPFLFQRLSEFSTPAAMAAASFVW